MNKLFHAGFTRLRKSKLFWALTIFSIGLAVFMVYTQYKDMKTYGDVIEVEQLFLNYSTITGIVIAIFTSLFLGVEYSDGAIRNKISIGCERIHIYLSNLLLVIFASFFSYIVFILVAAAIGIPLFGGITMSLSKLLSLLGCIFVTIIAYSGIFTLIAMLLSNKAISAVVSILLAFVLMMPALTCLNVLEQQEFVQEGSFVDGEMQFDVVANPRYPSEEERKLYQTLLDINPAGQMFQLAGRIAPNLQILPVYSLGEFILFSGGGILLFKKKELK